MYNARRQLLREYFKYLRLWPPQEKRRTQIRSLLRQNIKERIRDPPKGLSSSEEKLSRYLAKDLNSLKDITNESIKKVRLQLFTANHGQCTFPFNCGHTLAL